MISKIVCNSSPIIGLSIICKLDLLWQLFDEVFISEAVYNEIVFHDNIKNTTGIVELEKAILQDNIFVYKVINNDLVKQLSLKPLGILGILLLAKKKNKIGEIKPYLDALISRKFRISEKLYKLALKEAGEE